MFNCVEDTTTYACHRDLSTIICYSEAVGSVPANWFWSNFMKLIDDKSHLIIFGNKMNDAMVKIGNSEIKENTSEKLLGITFDKSIFMIYVKKASKKKKWKRISKIERNERKAFDESVTQSGVVCD